MGFLVAASASEAAVEYLYWQVEQKPGGAVEFDHAQLAVYKLNGESGEQERVVTADYPYGVYLGSKDNPSDFEYWEDSDDSRLTLPGRATAGIVDDWQGAAYSFQLELYNENWDLVGRGMLVSYEELRHAIFEGGSAGALHTWNAVGPAPVPEPTGGTLVLLGFALLGLRRKRFKSFDAMT